MEKEELDFISEPLNDFEKSVIIDKGTEVAFSGDYLYTTQKGVYLCRQGGAPRYRAEDKFEASCGWPSFDDELKGFVNRQPDADGEREEMTCAN